MSKTSTTATAAQNLLDEILSAGRKLTQKGKTSSSDLSKKGSFIAEKGEDILAAKLDIADTEEARTAMRKGVRAGAIGGALALLLFSRSARKLAFIGGLAGVGVLAYKAQQENGDKAPDSKEDISGSLSGETAEQRSDLLLKAMIAAAKCDGKISNDEMAFIKTYEPGAEDSLKAALKDTPDPKEIAAMCKSAQAAREVYAVSCRIADGLSSKERKYLDQLAMALQLDPEVAARIETDMRTG